MGSKSSIEWTESTWNPVTGCSKISAGCQHCYGRLLEGRTWDGKSDIKSALSCRTRLIFLQNVGRKALKNNAALPGA